MGPCDCSSGDSGHGSACGQDQAATQDAQLLANLKQIQHKLLVMSGKGGVGKSSVATYLAMALAKRGHRVGLLDVDLHGPSIPHLLGIQGMFPVDPVNKLLIPHNYNANLKVVSIECLLEDRDAAIIWRGPVKHGVIKQFLGEVQWGKLDYLVIDSPPGTGDEPLSVAQTIPDAHAVIVTTPQEVALADVRKSINFCRQVHLPILGLVENMSGLICPHCGEEVALFRKNGGARTAELMNVSLLGSLPFDPRVVEAGDAGLPVTESDDNGAFVNALNQMVQRVVDRCSPPEPGTMILKSENKESVMPELKNFKVAIPTANGLLCNHFGHCERFSVMMVKDGKIQATESLTPPPHEPGLLPKWIGEQGVELVIAGGMGQRAISLFNEQGVRVLTGAPALAPEDLVEQYLDGTLMTGANVCDH